MAATINSRIRWIVPLLIAVCLMSLQAQGKYSGGSGTAEDPYQIATAEDLIALGETPEDYDKHFKLVADIDLAGHVFNKAVIAPDTDPEKDYYQGIPFTGVLDGNGHAISHLTIVGQRYLGFFGRLDSAASVANLGLEAVEVNATGNWDVGGLAGGNLGRITQCYSSGSVSGTDYVGGLVGYNSPGASIAASYARGMVSGDRNVGGLVGRNYGTITSSYSTGTVSGDQYVGGLVGFNDHFSSIVSSYSTGAVRGDRNVGGLVGHNLEGSVTQCYSTGAVSGTGGTVGGLVGSGRGDCVSASFWDIQTSGRAASAGGRGLTTLEMQDINTFLDGGWDFVDEVLNGTCDYWEISPGGYPQLRWHPGESPVMPEGLGTAEQPYLIRDARDLGTLWFEPMAHYRLEASVNLSGITWSGAVVPRFEGLFDGNGHVISSLTVRGARYLGLFGHLHSSARVNNLGLEAVDINGTGEYIGGLVGYNSWGASIAASYARGPVSGARFVGGLVGFNHYFGSIVSSYSTGVVNGSSEVGGLVGDNGGKVTQCYSTAAIDGNDYIGGLVGSNWGEVAQCYSTGVVNGSSFVGGLVGSNGGNVNQSYSTSAVIGISSVAGLVGYNDSRGIVTQCYSTGEVSGKESVGGLVGSHWMDYVTASFWDVQTSAQTTSAGGTGKTTAEMQMASTFFGWGCTPTVWTIDDGVDYPRLAWESKPGKPLTALAEFIEGSGSEADPYLICTGDDLNRIGLFVFDWDKHFKLMADIDLSGFDGINGRPAFNTIAPGQLDYLGYFKGTPFTGVFDGNGHEIQNLTVIVADGGCAGLIGGLGGGGEVKNLGVVDVNIASSGGGVGGLVGVVEWGWSSSGGSVKRCYSTGIVLGDYYVGGLVGINRGTITQCHSDAFVSGSGGDVGGLLGTNGGYVSLCYSIGTVSGNWSVGGLVGSNGKEQVDGWEGEVTNCYSTSEVYGKEFVGGLVGVNDLSSIIHCYSTGWVTGTEYVGGLVGLNKDWGMVTQSYGTGAVSGSKYVGGLVGFTGGGTITRSYAAGSVSGNKYVGGLVGLNSGPWWSAVAISNCYATGLVLGDEYVGGLVGEGDANDVVASFWDTQTSGQTTSGGGTGESTAEMQTGGTFTEAGWDFVGETANGTEDIWAICEGVDYPHLAWEFVIGDFDADADTDFADFCILAEHWLAADGSFWCGQGCDLTNDGSVNWQDLMVFTQNWLTAISP